MKQNYYDLFYLVMAISDKWQFLQIVRNTVILLMGFDIVKPKHQKCCNIMINKIQMNKHGKQALYKH